LAVLLELIARGHECRIALDKCVALVLHNMSWDWLAIILHERWLIVKHLQLAGRADHEHINHPLRLGPKHRRLGRGGVEQFRSGGGGKRLGNASAKQRRERHLANADSTIRKELPASNLPQMRGRSR